MRPHTFILTLGSEYSETSNQEPPTGDSNNGYDNDNDNDQTGDRTSVDEDGDNGISQNEGGDIDDDGEDKTIYIPNGGYNSTAPDQSYPTSTVGSIFSRGDLGGTVYFVFFYECFEFILLCYLQFNFEYFLPQSSSALFILIL